MNNEDRLHWAVERAMAKRWEPEDDDEDDWRTTKTVECLRCGCDTVATADDDHPTCIDCDTE